MTIWDFTPGELLARGGPLMWPLFAFSILSLALILDRAIVFFRMRLDYRAFTRSLGELVRARKFDDALAMCRRSENAVARVAEVYLENLELDDEARTRIIEREGSLVLERAEARLRGLSAIGSLAPLVGLLGTVVGLVAAFHQIEQNAGQVQAGDLASGIWEALLTTVFGLCISIPSILMFNVFESKADRMARWLGFTVSYLDQWFGRKASGEAVPISERYRELTPDPEADRRTALREQQVHG